MDLQSNRLIIFSRTEDFLVPTYKYKLPSLIPWIQKGSIHERIEELSKIGRNDDGSIYRKAGSQEYVSGLDCKKME